MSDIASSESRTARRTLRGRVSLLGLAVIAAWVVVLTAGFDLAMHARLNGERDTVLRNRAATVAATVFVSSTGVVTVHDRSGDEALDSGIWVYSAKARHRTPGRRPGAPGGRGFAGRTRQDFRLERQISLVFAQPLMVRHRQVGTVVASSSDTPYQRALIESIEGSAVVAVLLLAGAYPVLRFAAGRALQPVDAMTRQAGHWSAHGLNERFGPDQKFREVQSLAHTLDAVLDRLAAVVRHERRLPAELSHELRTPLSRIVAEVDLLQARAAHGGGVGARPTTPSATVRCR